MVHNRKEQQHELSPRLSGDWHKSLWIMFLFTATDVIFGKTAATHSGWWWSHRLTTIQVCCGFWICQYCREVSGKNNFL